MGQGQTKASKRRETNGEQGPSPKKEAKKSPKKSRTSKSSKSSVTESPSQGEVAIPERDSSPTRRKPRKSNLKDAQQEQRDSREVNGNEQETIIASNVISALETKPIDSPPKPKRTYEVEFVEQDKENVPEDCVDGINVSEIIPDSSPKTSVRMNGHDKEPFITPVKYSDRNTLPQATSTPAPNGIIGKGHRRHSSGPQSDDDHTDVSDDEAYSSEQQLHVQTPSPTASNVSLKSFSTVNSPSLRTKSCLMHSLAGMCLPTRMWHSTNQVQDSSYERKTEVNYGKFYNTSYLDKAGSLHRIRTASAESPQRNPNQFSRPANFSYSKEPPSFLKSKKTGMMKLAEGKPVIKTRSSSPAPVTTKVTTTKVATKATTGIPRNEEAIKMSMFPGGKKPPAMEIAKIERDDWPAPPSPAAILPEILRQRRKSHGEPDEDEEEEVFEDPKIKREIEELKKFKDESGIGKIIYRELEEAKVLPSKPLDPWKASRVPNANYEPKYQTRYQSPMFASPSRFLDRPRWSWDDSDIRGYRTISMAANFSAPKPGYGLAARAATLPVSGLYGGPLDYRFYDLELSDSKDTRVSTSSINTEASKVTSTIFDHPGVSLMTFQKSSWHTEAKPPEYPYERLKITNFDLPKDVDRNQLEIHMDKGEFESIFEMSVDEFNHLPEWKRNDMKRKKDLY